MKPTEDSTHFTRRGCSQSRVNLTDRDLDLLLVLVRKVRLLSINQVANSWWPCAKKTRSCSRRMIQLAVDGYIRQLQVMSHPPVKLDTWVIKWKKNNPTPNFEAASYKMKKRWTLAPENTSVIFATNRTRTLFGDWGAYIPRPAEIAHDLHLSAVFLKMREQRPALAESWIGEAVLAKQRFSPNEKIPDALAQYGQEKLVIDFGGSYSANRLRELHDFCLERNYGYEVW